MDQHHGIKTVTMVDIVNRDDTWHVHEHIVMHEANHL